MEPLSLALSAGGLAVGMAGLGWGISRDVRARRREKQRDERDAEREAAQASADEAAAKAATVQRERERRGQILATLRGEYIASNDGLSSQMLAGTEPLPKDWVEARLQSMGEEWRQEVY